LKSRLPCAYPAIKKYPFVYYKVEVIIVIKEMTVSFAIQNTRERTSPSFFWIPKISIMRRQGPFWKGNIGR
jgi:hypothetical protein